MNPSEEIKQKLDIVDVVKDYIPLKAAGINFTAPCPFHREKTPSFMVSPEKQIFHCFGCGKSGDIFTFVQEMDGLSFPEALRMLAPKAGVTLKAMDPSLATKRNGLLDIMELSAKYFHHILMNEKVGESAKKYLTDRGLTEKTIEEWQIGYSLDTWDNLLNFLKKRGYRDDEIFAAGMSSKKQGGRNYFDRFRGRIMFPIKDINGNVVAFTARVSPEREATEKMGKYINSPQTELYDKSRIIFGLDKAKMTIKSEDKAILVEGQMDVITAHQHGYKNVVASSGTALTAEQLKMIKRYTENIYMSFDSDDAGKIARDRGVQEALKQNFAIKIISILTGKDPDDCIKESPELWEKAILEAKHFIKFCIDDISTKYDQRDPKENNRAIDEVLLLIDTLPNQIEKDFWLKELCDTHSQDENSLRKRLDTISKKGNTQNDDRDAAENDNFETPKSSSRIEKLNHNLMALIFRFPELIDYAVKGIEEEQIYGNKEKALYKNILLYYNKFNPSEVSDGGFFEFKNFLSWLNDEEKGLMAFANEIIMKGERDFYTFDAESAKKELLNTITLLKKSSISRKRLEIEQRIKKSEKNNNTSIINELLEEHKLLTQELKNLED